MHKQYTVYSSLDLTKQWVFNCLLKDESESALWMWSSKLFQSVGATMEKALSLYVDVQDLRMTRSPFDDTSKKMQHCKRVQADDSQYKP